MRHCNENKTPLFLGANLITTHIKQGYTDTTPYITGREILDATNTMIIATTQYR